MFRSQLRRMILLIAFHTKMGVLSDTIIFCIFRRNLVTIFTKRSFRLLLFLSVNHIINNINGKNLVIFENNILMLKYLWVFVFIVKID